MSDEILNDKDPFGEDEEEEDLISEAMVKKATYLIHKLAEQRKEDFKEIQKKCKKLFAYTNLAKVTMVDGHAIIDKLIELIDGEEETASPAPSTQQLPTKPHDDISTREIAEADGDELLSEIGKLAEMLQICAGYSADIVREEIGKENVSEGTRAMLVKSFTATLFIEASKRGLGR